MFANETTIHCRQSSKWTDKTRPTYIMFVHSLPSCMAGIVTFIIWNTNSRGSYVWTTCSRAFYILSSSHGILDRFPEPKTIIRGWMLSQAFFFFFLLFHTSFVISVFVLFGFLILCVTPTVFRRQLTILRQSIVMRPCYCISVIITGNLSNDSQT